MNIIFCLVALLPVGQEDGVARKRIVGWWKDAALCAELGLEEDQTIQLADQLKNLQYSYQLASTRLTAARKKQAEMFLEADLDAEEIQNWHEEQVRQLSAALLEYSFKARLLVRQTLSQAQLAHIADKFPHFFTKRWFQRPRVPVRQGKVIEKDP